MIFLAVFAAAVFAYTLVSKWVDRVATAPMMFTLAGILAPFLVPALRAPDYHISRYLWVAEAGLVLLLFTDATRTDLSLLARIRDLPARLLGPGLLLTIGLGVLVARLLLPGLEFWEACVLAAVLAPTDAGLGQVIVESPRVPIRIREALNVEAGLNDGLAVPFLLFFMAMIEAGGGPTEASITLFVGEQLGLGILVGAGVGLAGGWGLRLASRAGALSQSFAPRGLLALPVLCFLIADWLGASMFIAAFVAGLAAQWAYHTAGRHAVELADQGGHLLNLAVFFLFGLTVERAWRYMEPEFVLYALLSLTVVRMLPVALSLWGTGLRRPTTLFIGWFGPRGLASIVLGLVFVERELHTPGDSTVLGVVIATVLLSILLHGLSARPGIAWYARRLADFPPGAPELGGEAARGRRDAI